MLQRDEAMRELKHVYEVRPRKDHRGVDLISDALPFGRRGMAVRMRSAMQSVTRSITAAHTMLVICVYDEASNVIEAHEQAANAAEWLSFRSHQLPFSANTNFAMNSPLSGKWVGTIQGTNLGSVIAEFAETNGLIAGVVNIIDNVHGIGIYAVTESRVNPDHIRLVLTPNQLTQMAGHGIVTVLGRLISETVFVGDWRSSIGTAGTLSVTKAIMEPQFEIASSNKGRVTVPRRTKVFISYNHRDSDWLERLRVHLKPLERDYALDIWDDTQIQAGANWVDEIERAIQSAKVGLLIVSADFLASDFIANDELPPLLEAAQNDGAVIMSLIVSPSRFKSTKSLSQFQAINNPSRPLINMTKGDQEQILVKVSEKIEALFRST